MRLRTLAATGATALALAACGGGPSSPEEAVADGLGDRLENGATFALSFDGDIDSLLEPGEDMPPEAQAFLAGDAIRGAFHPEDGIRLTLGTGNGFFEFLAVDESLYVRVDLEGLRAFSPDAAQEIPDAATLRGFLDEVTLPPNLQALATAALDGEWVGITGLSEEAVNEWLGSMGMPAPDPADIDEDRLREALENHGLTDGSEFTDRYLTVSGDGPTYDLTVHARAFVTSLRALATELQDSMGGLADDAVDLPDPSEVPETIEGFSLTVDGGKATRLAADIGTLAASVGETGDDVPPAGALQVILDLGDLGNELAAPSTAATISLDELATAIMQFMMAGFALG